MLRKKGKKKSHRRKKERDLFPQIIVLHHWSVIQNIVAKKKKTKIR